jgi:hypothetical protein
MRFHDERMMLELTVIMDRVQSEAEATSDETPRRRVLSSRRGCLRGH